MFILRLRSFWQTLFCSFLLVLSTFLKKILIFSHNYDEICKKYLPFALIIELIIYKTIFSIQSKKKLNMQN